MAHDFGIKRKTEKNFHYFFGYADGIAYSSFGMNHHNAFISGDGCVERVSAERGLNGLRTFVKKFDEIDYPDPKRANEIKAFLQYCESNPSDEEFDLYYG